MGRTRKEIIKDAMQAVEELKELIEEAKKNEEECLDYLEGAINHSEDDEERTELAQNLIDIYESAMFSVKDIQGYLKEAKEA